jgi:hypothetical protein
VTIEGVRGGRFLVVWLAFGALYAAAVSAQRTDAFVVSRDHPAIDYTKGPTKERLGDLNRRLREGTARLTFDPATGYLRSTLEALQIPVESQVAVFAQNAFQADLIGLKNPRTVFFNDAVAVGYVRGGRVLEVAAHDPRQGIIFYTLDQKATDAPQFTRNDNCLACHLSWTTLGVPGLFVLSMQTLPEDKNAYASGFASDHRTTFDTRWGGWYVTGSLGALRHIGNKPVSTASTPDAVPAEARELKSLSTQFDTTGYLSSYSDVAALMVLEHQTHMANLIIRMGWEARLVSYEQPGADLKVGAALEQAGGTLGRAGATLEKNQARLQEAATDLVDYMLFVYEVPLPDKVRGSSGFAETFGALGPADDKGRSLRQLDLDRRLMRYPCSYMIYSDAFDALPESAKSLVYRRLWQVLSGQDKDARYARLSAVDRRAIVEILRGTKKDLPDYFQ